MLTFIEHMFLILLLFLFLFYYGTRMFSKTRMFARGMRDSSLPALTTRRSLPFHYGLFMASGVTICLFALLVIFSFFIGSYAENLILSQVREYSYIEIGSLKYERLVLQVMDKVFYAESSDFPFEYMNEVDSIAAAISPSILFAYLSFYVFELILLVFLFKIIKNRMSANFPAYYYLELSFRFIIFLCAFFTILVTFGIIFSLIFEALRFFSFVPLDSFLFGTHWNLQLATSNLDAGNSGGFGLLPLLSGTLLITLIALSIAGPIGLSIAIYMSEFASRSFRSLIKPVMELLAGIPTVVYGFFAISTLAPGIRKLAAYFDIAISSEPAIVAGVTIGVMIIPFISSLSDDIMNAVPQSLRDGSYALGSTKTETVTRVVIPAALPGIAGGFLLATSRSIGETMIVVMAAGMTAQLTLNPFESVTTITVQMTSILTGDQEFDSAKTLAAFALGFTLFLITLFLNYVALRVVRSYREVYE